MNRRRFLSISACALGAPSLADTVTWSGYALGAEVSIKVRAPETLALNSINRVRERLSQVESCASLYDPNSELSHLNRDKSIQASGMMFDLVNTSTWIHDLTLGRFDPTIQTAWLDFANGHRSDIRSLWAGVEITDTHVILPQDVSLSFNGIAQGYATDVVRLELEKMGFENVLVNIGEYYGQGGPWSIGIADPIGGLIKSVEISDQAIATSSPKAMMIAEGQGHIIDPISDAPYPWSTLSVTASTAMLADGLSTGFSLLSEQDIRSVINDSLLKIGVTGLGTDGHVFSVDA